MKFKLRKYFISFGLLFLFSLFTPYIFNVNIAQATVIEKEKNDEYKLNLKNITLVKGKTFALKVYNLKDNVKVSYKSADPETASVNDDGLITANKVGTTTITVTIKDGTVPTTLTTDVTVGPPAFSVKLTRSKIILGLNDADSVNVIMKPSNTTELPLFSSHNEAIAYVTSGGRISAKSLGLTYIFAAIDAKNNDGTSKFAYCTVIVTSTENVAPLKNYFDEHPELNLIPEEELRIALEEFFNKPVASNNTKSATSDNNAKDTTAASDSTKATTAASDITKASTTTSDNTKNSTTAADSVKTSTTVDSTKTTSASDSTKAASTESESTKSFVETLDQYLNKKFNLAELRKSMQ